MNLMARVPFSAMHMRTRCHVHAYRVRAQFFKKELDCAGKGCL